MDSLLELEINDGRRPATKAARRFERELLRRKTGWYGKKYQPEQDFEIAPLVSKFRLMTALQVLTTNGETTYLSDYLRVSDSLRADLRALNLSGIMPNPAGAGESNGDKEEGSTALNLEKLSVPELLILRFLVAKLHDEPGDSDIYETLLEMARSLHPPLALLEYCPPVEEAPVKVRQSKPSKPVPPAPQGETEEQKDQRIQNYHWQKMRKDLVKDPDPWDL